MRIDKVTMNTNMRSIWNETVMNYFKVLP